MRLGFVLDSIIPSSILVHDLCGIEGQFEIQDSNVNRKLIMDQNGLWHVLFLNMLFTTVLGV